MNPSAAAARRAYAEGPAGQVHYYDGGGDGVPLLMIHQAPTSAMDFAPTFPFFKAAGVRVLAMDMPGFGLSDPTPEPATIADYAAAGIAVMDHAGVARAAALGHHTGAKVAIEAGVRYPDRISRVAFYGSSLADEAERRRSWERYVPKEKEGRVHKPEPGAAHLIDQFDAFYRYGGPEAAQSMLTSVLLAGPKWWYGHNAALTHDGAPSIRALTQPLLIVSNEGEMLHGEALKIKAFKPEAELVVMDTSSPIAMYDEPKLFAETVARFVRGG